MNQFRWPEVKRILESALELAGEARESYLREACGSDAELRAEVDAFLGYEQQAGHVFDITNWRASATPQPEATPPARLGPYRVLRPLGEGGMGAVYLAERDDGEFKLTVAVKVVRPTLDMAHLLRLFRQERQILARLEHPYIARLLDGGATPDGQLYYAMEYVDGQPLTVWARERGQTVNHRLELFAKVCEAVGYAHRALVIHRDLKPANILVTADGTPKLLDFGLARVFEPSTTTQPTMTVAALLTPGYASPEQVRGEPLSTSTDVYSLGVVLYELLAGKSPYGQPTTSPLEALRAVCETDPRPPSEHSRLPRDLDAIVLKALRKEPAGRYASVDDLRRDIIAYLNGRPVEAARGSRLYRARKFARRHRWGVGATAVAFLGVALAVGAVLWQARQTERRFNQVRQLAHAVVFELHDAIQGLPGSTPARKLLIGRALQYLNDLSATGGNDRDLQLELAAAYIKIGDVQGHRRDAHLGDHAGALASFKRARQILIAMPTDDGEAVRLLLQADAAICDLHEVLGDNGAWLAARPELIRVAQRAVELNPQSKLDHARLYATIGYGLVAYRLWAESIQVWQRAAGVLDGLDSNDEETLQLEYRIESNLARLYHELGDLPESVRHFHLLRRVQERRLSLRPQDANLRMMLSFVSVDLGWVLHMQGDERGAIAAYEDAMAEQAEQARQDPNDYRARSELAKLMLTAAPAYEAVGRTGRSLELLHDAVGRLERELRTQPANEDLMLHIGWAQLLRGDALLRAHRTEEALMAYRASIASLRSMNLTHAALGIFDPQKMIAHNQQQLDPARREMPKLMR